MMDLGDFLLVEGAKGSWNSHRFNKGKAFYSIVKYFLNISLLRRIPYKIFPRKGLIYGYGT